MSFERTYPEGYSVTVTCDRCNASETAVTHEDMASMDERWTDINVAGGGRWLRMTTHSDLCPDCAVAFNAWMDER